MSAAYMCAKPNKTTRGITISGNSLLKKRWANSIKTNKATTATSVAVG